MDVLDKVKFLANSDALRVGVMPPVTCKDIVKDKEISHGKDIAATTDD